MDRKKNLIARAKWLLPVWAIFASAMVVLCFWLFNYQPALTGAPMADTANHLLKLFWVLPINIAVFSLLGVLALRENWIQKATRSCGSNESA